MSMGEPEGHRLNLFTGRFEHLLTMDFSQERAIAGQRRTFDVMVIPGTTAATRTLAAGSFTASINRPYVVDPRSFVFQAIRSPEVAALPKYERLAKEHGPRLATILERGGLTTTDLRDGPLLHELVDAMLTFQASMRSATERKRMEKFARLLAEVDESPDAPAQRPTPFVLVPPYFACDTAVPSADHEAYAWFKANVAMAEIGAALKGTYPLCPVIALSARMVQRERREVIEAYGGNQFDGYFVLIDDFDEYNADQEMLWSVREFVRELNDHYDKPVMNLAGGYFSVLLYHFGLAGLSHGPGYGESRAITGSAALKLRDGGPRQRYYVEPYHRFLPRPDAELALQTLGVDFWCQCAACTPARSLDRFELAYLSSEQLVSHFLGIRDAEISGVLSSRLPDLLLWLEEARAEAVMRDDPNAPVRPQIDNTEHLHRWVQALRQ